MTDTNGTSWAQQYSSIYLLRLPITHTILCEPDRRTRDENALVFPEGSS